MCGASSGVPVKSFKKFASHECKWRVAVVGLFLIPSREAQVRDMTIAHSIKIAALRSEALQGGLRNVQEDCDLRQLFHGGLEAMAQLPVKAHMSNARIPGDCSLFALIRTQY
eukprot:1154443-Pelagomonas_calceolata.AAC.1